MGYKLKYEEKRAPRLLNA